MVTDDEIQDVRASVRNACDMGMGMVALVDAVLLLVEQVGHAADRIGGDVAQELRDEIRKTNERVTENARLMRAGWR